MDTNILVYARKKCFPQHQKALKILYDLAEGSELWALPRICIYEFLRVVTHPKMKPPTSLKLALEDISSLLTSPTLRILEETEQHWKIFNDLALQANTTGNLIFDTNIAALCLENGITEIITADQDFARFKSLKVINPF